MSRQISRSRSRLLGLEGGIETKSRYLNLDRRDQLFESVEIYSTVETSSLPVSISRVSIEIWSRQIKTPKAKKTFSFKKLLLETFCRRNWKKLPSDIQSKVKTVQHFFVVLCTVKSLNVIKCNGIIRLMWSNWPW